MLVNRDFRRFNCCHLAVHPWFWSNRVLFFPDPCEKDPGNKSHEVFKTGQALSDCLQDLQDQQKQADSRPCIFGSVEVSMMTLRGKNNSHESEIIGWNNLPKWTSTKSGVVGELILIMNNFLFLGNNIRNTIFDLPKSDFLTVQNQHRISCRQNSPSCLR